MLTGLFGPSRIRLCFMSQSFEMGVLLKDKSYFNVGVIIEK